MGAEILVIGGTGVIGSELMRELDGRAMVRALVHTQGSAEALARRHPSVELVRGDLGDPASLPSAFAGISRLFLLTPSVADQLSLEENALDFALGGGSERIVYVSNNEVNWGIELSRAHETIERRLAESGLPCTVLRPDYLLDNLLHEAEELAAGRMTTPSGDARCAFVDARDVGSVAATALLADEPLRGPLVLTGPDLLSWAELAARLSDALQISVEHVDPHPAEWEEAAAEAGMPPWLAGALREYFERLRTEALTPSDDVLRATGNAPRSVEEFARDRLAPALRRAAAEQPQTISDAPPDDDGHHFATTPRRREHA